MSTPEEPKPAMTAPPIPCSAGCKRSVPAADILGSGWYYLEITGRYRCPTCTRELVAAGKL
jgi:hypothetical protein